MTTTTARPDSLRPLRFGITFLVLAGVITTVVACSSGDAVTGADNANAVSASASDGEVVAKLEQGLGWKGGCACLPVAQCPTTACVNGTITRECVELRCKADSSACYVEEDGTQCLTSGTLPTKSTCDGGFCGTCGGCYNGGLCFPGNTVAMCGPKGKECRSCNDLNPCTTDACSSTGGCSNVALDDKTSCSGGACFGGKCCTTCQVNGVCQGGATIEACGTGGGECKTCEKPSNPCLRATCTAGGCGTEPVPVGTTCSDGKFCNGNEACDGQGTCVAGTPPDCTSSDPCLTKQCDETQQKCSETPNLGAKCSDGNACTTGDACDASGKCTSTGAKNCNDGKVCTSDECDPTTGDCVYSPVTDGNTCDDGNSCTTGEVCRSGLCTAGAISCDDNNICTLDTLDCQTSLCSHAPVAGAVACVPTDKCFYNGDCNQGQCVGKTPVNCDDGNPCTKDSCDSASGCIHTNESNTTACSDGNPCTTDDRCRITGKCAGTPIICAALDECHMPGICDAATGRCGSDPRRDDGAPCATGTGSCVSGACQINATGGSAGVAGASGLAGGGGIVATAGTAGSLAMAGTAGSLNANAGFAGELSIPSFGGINAGGTTGNTDAALGGASGNAPTGTKGGQPGSNIDEHDIYRRDPGGCSCNVPNQSSRNGLAGLALFGLAWAAKRRRQRSR